MYIVWLQVDLSCIKSKLCILKRDKYKAIPDVTNEMIWWWRGRLVLVPLRLRLWVIVLKRGAVVVMTHGL